MNCSLFQPFSVCLLVASQSFSLSVWLPIFSYFSPHFLSYLRPPQEEYFEALLLRAVRLCNFVVRVEHTFAR